MSLHKPRAVVRTRVMTENSPPTHKEQVWKSSQCEWALVRVNASEGSASHTCQILDRLHLLSLDLCPQLGCLGEGRGGLVP